jgi:hypothetical protein
MTTPYPARKKNVIEVNGKTRRSFFLRRLRLVHAVASHCKCVFLVTSGAQTANLLRGLTLGVMHTVIECPRGGAQRKHARCS